MIARPPITRPSFLATGYSPYLNRAALEGPRTIRARMADDMRHISACQDSVTEDDLELLGWTSEQIAAHRREAARLAHARAAKERETAGARQ